MESFYRTLKVELIYQNTYQIRREAQRDIFEYIEIFYNRERLHSSLGYYSPDYRGKTKEPSYRMKETKEWLKKHKEVEDFSV